MVKNKRWYPINAKEYLNQIRRISCEIAAKEAELSELEKTLHGAALQEVRVKTSASHDPMKLVDVIVDFQCEIRQEIAQAISLKKEIHHKINQLSKPIYVGVLTDYYINNLEWCRISERLHISERQLYRIHGNALSEFRKKFDMV